MRRYVYIVLIFLSLPLLTGCSSFAKGMVQGVMEHKGEEVKLLCEIAGPPFDSVSASLDRQGANGGKHHTKIMMVHGIGKHLPDYSARFREKLMRALDMDSMDPTVKKFTLTNQQKNGEPAGLLKVFRYYDGDTGKDVLFYELTWSSISDEAKKSIAFDDSDAYSYRRANVNKTLKGFMNATVPDLLVYEGVKQPVIEKAVGQSACWMMKDQWQDLPDESADFCDIKESDVDKNLQTDDYFIVTHSLGSRVTSDTFNAFALRQKPCPNCAALEKPIKNETFTIFMLANQLPLLQVGHPYPPVTGKVDEYCQPKGIHYNHRALGKLRVVAFSDPNDILSYPLPADFAEKYLDSRTCPEIVNVELNVAPPINILDIAQFANPLEAHSGYEQDDRVIEIIAAGLNKNKPNPLITEKCNWTNISIKQEK